MEIILFNFTTCIMRSRVWKFDVFGKCIFLFFQVDRFDLSILSQVLCTSQTCYVTIVLLCSSFLGFSFQFTIKIAHVLGMCGINLILVGLKKLKNFENLVNFSIIRVWDFIVGNSNIQIRCVLLAKLALFPLQSLGYLANVHYYDNYTRVMDVFWIY